METKKRATSTITTRVDAGVIYMTVIGEAEPIVFDPRKCNEALRERAELHGWIQRLSDAAALSRDPETGRAADPADKARAIRALAEFYQDPATTEWGRRREGGGGASPAGGVTLQALADVQGVGVDVMRKRVDELAERKGVKPSVILRDVAKSPAVAKRIGEIKAARAKAGPDVEELLGELTA